MMVRLPFGVSNAELILSMALLVVGFLDEEVRMGTVIDVKQELRKANALKINYSTRKGTY